MKWNWQLIKQAEDQLRGGKADGMPDQRYDQRELAKGVKVEYEHTDDFNAAKQIAKDHLEEIPDYYTRLAAMEEEAEELKEKSARTLLDRVYAIEYKIKNS